MYRFITVLGIVALLFVAACERQEQRPAERATPGTQQRETTPPPSQTPGQAPSQTPGQTQEQAPGQTPGALGQTPGQAPAGGEQRQ